LIVGAGPIGVFHVMLSRISGARKIIVSNAGAHRLEAAKALGADVTVDVLSQDLREVVMAETDGRGADVIVTAVSSPQVQAEAVRLLATHGRVNFFAGLGKGVGVEIDTNLVHYKGLTLTGTTGSSNADYAAALRLVADRRVDLTTMVSATFTLDRISEAFEHSSSGVGMKAMVTFE
jgi:threonine dehydrogenase-like Zn-dependent dehydrogenase